MKRLSQAGDPLEEMARVVNFEASRPLLEEGVGYSEGSKGDPPPDDPVDASNNRSARCCGQVKKEARSGRVYRASYITLAYDYLT
jgi:hypothetical protein